MPPLEHPPRERETREYLEDMLLCCNKAQSFVKDLSPEEFFSKAEDLNYHATLRQLTLIGWFAYNLPQSMLKDHPQVPWRFIIATSYALETLIDWHLENDVIWEFVEEVLPKLKPALENMLESVKNQEQQQKVEGVITEGSHLAGSSSHHEEEQPVPLAKQA